jgi:hypothetical protein
MRQALALLLLLCVLPTGFVAHAAGQDPPCADHDGNRHPWFGDLHVHTRYSLDASTQGTRTSPAQAYAFARGEPIGIQPWSDQGLAARSLQLRRPLDFAMVSDHAELIGEVNMCNNPGVEGYDSWQCLLYRHLPRAAYYLFNYMAAIRQAHLGMCGEGAVLCLDAARAPWEEMQRAARVNNNPDGDCAFTTFVGYEWTGVQSDSGGNLHRNVLFKGDTVPELPVSYIDAPGAELLWNALEEQCTEREGCDALVIPHNSNLSAGFMFNGRDDAGRPMTAEYAARRAAFEPLVEVMQHKGASECYFAMGGEDELCAFEQLPIDNIAGYSAPPRPDTGFVRRALIDGLRLARALGVNPYQFGMVASTDTHLGAPGAVEEDRFLGHGGAGVPARSEVPVGLPDKLEYNPGGLAVIWAEENSRQSLFAAMRRRETYATSGPRIVSRLFAGRDFDAALCDSSDRIEQGYARGVPMGAVLPPGEGAPRFLVAASRDPGTADAPGVPLQRIQLVKGWVDAAGNAHTQVMDVAGDADNGASVDLLSCELRGNGFDELCTVWEDESFDPALPAFYYTRVIENPSCRWSQRQCTAAGVDCARPETIKRGFDGCCAAEHRPVVQERAWSSPVWYLPPMP